MSDIHDQFLSQLHEPLHFERVERRTSFIFAYVAPYNFVIPRWVLVQSCDVPEQCLSLPPSLDHRRGLTGVKGARGLSQPHIAYNLHLKVVIRSEEICPQTTHEAWEEIKLLPYTDDYPPTDIRDFPGEFVQHMTNTFRTTMFNSMSHRMMMFMEEPAALHLRRLRCTTNTEILVEVEIASGEINVAHVGRLISRLQQLKFEINVELRVKTFHSTIPFPKLPSQSPSTSKGQLRLSDEFLKLGTTKTKPAFWNDLPSPSSQLNESIAGRSSPAIPPSFLTNQPRNYSATIRAPIVLPSTLLPTFCSVVVARQYSLITHVKAAGVSIRAFRLEVPLQVIYPAPTSAGHAVSAGGPSAILQ